MLLICILLKDHITLKGMEYKEAIQIDFSGYDGLKYINAKYNDVTYDGTHCNNIVISKNTFINCPTCIGTHTQCILNKYHKNIIIKDNKAVGQENIGNFVKLINMHNIQILNNDIKNFYIPIFINDFKSGRYPQGNKSSPIETKVGCDNVLIENNNIENQKYSSGIYIATKRKVYHKNITIQYNTFKVLQGDYILNLSYVNNLYLNDNLFSDNCLKYKFNKVKNLKESE
jgi:hypothetical protein